MFFKNRKDKFLQERLLEELIKLNNKMSEKRILDFAEMLGNTKKMLIRNFTSGILKGIGAGIGFSLITAIIIYIIQKIIKLNIPVISNYIADIVEIIQKSK